MILHLAVEGSWAGCWRSLHVTPTDGDFPDEGESLSGRAQGREAMARPRGLPDRDSEQLIARD